jgi:hypothetical protein
MSSGLSIDPTRFPSHQADLHRRLRRRRPTGRHPSGGDAHPKARDDLRRGPIRDQADRDAISLRLMRYRDRTGDDWADIIDFLTMCQDARHVSGHPSISVGA